MPRTRPLALLVSTVLALSTPAVAQSGAPPSTEADRAKARELMKEGNELYTRGELAAAYTKYRDAWRTAKSFDIACNVGGTASELALYREAAEYLDYCLRHYAASSRPEAVQAEERAREAFEAVKKKVVQVTLKVEPLGAEVAVDGKRQGIAPLSAPVFVEPGKHRFEATHPGYLPAGSEVEPRAGDALEVTLTLERESARTAPPVPPDRQEQPRPAGSASKHPKLVYVLAGAGLAAVGLGVGIGFTLNASSIGDDKQKRIDALGGTGACGGNEPANSEECSAIADLNDDQKTSRALGVTGFVVGGVAAAGTLVYALWPRDSRTAGNRGTRPAERAALPAARLELDGVGATATPGGAMVGLSGRF